MTLKDYSTEELKDELAKRSCPQELTTIDLDALRIECEAYINSLLEYTNYDTQHIVETAMEALYGPKVWDWINGRLR